MLLYYCAGDTDLDRVLGSGLSAAPGSTLALWPDLEEAQSNGKGRILVIDPAKFSALPEEYASPVYVPSVPAEAVLNAPPYLPPKAVTAAGGLVVRHAAVGPEVLLIFRRGVWDLPKGKLDNGETAEAGALREVREEVGIRELEIVAALGTTLHGYAERGAYRVKTTHWFLMQTPETAFTPQKDEDIERVEWVPWPQAVRQVGFETLRQHMLQHTEAVRATAPGSTR